MEALGQHMEAAMKATCQRRWQQQSECMRHHHFRQQQQDQEMDGQETQRERTQLPQNQNLSAVSTH
jgi:hypothetical protein